MSLFEDGIVSEERLLASLERIAMCLEVLAGLGRPSEGGERGFEGELEPFSGISYQNDKDDYEKELRRDDYYQRTGIQLPPGEDPPAVPASKFDRAP